MPMLTCLAVYRYQYSPRKYHLPEELVFLMECSGVDLGGQGGQCPPFKNFLLICYYYYKQHENFIQWCLIIIKPQELHT